MGIHTPSACLPLTKFLGGYSVGKSMYTMEQF
jgi:hypothetical protein